MFYYDLYCNCFEKGILCVHERMQETKFTKGFFFFPLSLEWKNLTGLHRAMTSTFPTPLGWTGMLTVSRITSHQCRTSLKQQQLNGRESRQPVFRNREESLTPEECRLLQRISARGLRTTRNVTCGGPRAFHQVLLVLLQSSRGWSAY